MVVRSTLHRSFYVLGLVLLLISINPGQAPAQVEAQNSEWSTPQTIPGYDPATWPPILVADQNRTVHAFSSQPVDGGGGEIVEAVFYNRWTLEHGWTFPTDILLSPYKDARVTDARLDRKGILHVLFFGGDSTGADIYYSQAPAATADDPHAWSAPIIIGADAGDPEGAVFYEDDQGMLYVLYNGSGVGNGLYVVHSVDGGSTWSNPAPIFMADDQAPVIVGLHVIRSKSGWLHAVWNTRDVGGQGRGLYYAQSKNGTDWSEPILLDSAPTGYGVLFPAIIEYESSLFVIYLQTPKVKMRVSRDNGQSWEDPTTLFARYVGVNGSPSLAVDSNQGLHLFFGQRIDATASTPEISGMWHSAWVSNRWLEPEAVAEGPSVFDHVGDTSFVPYEARAVVSQGNVILVTWRTDPGLHGNGVWFSYKVLNAPELPISTPAAQTLQTVALPPNPQAVVNSPDSKATTNPDINDPSLFDKASPAKSLNVGSPLALGMLSAVILILVVVGVARTRP